MIIHCPTCNQPTIVGTNGCCSWCDTHLDATRPAPKTFATKLHPPRKQTPAA